VARDTKECRSGTTAIAALLDQRGKVHFGSLGDSILIARRSEGVYTSTHHNVKANKRERERVMARGGFYDRGYARKYFDGSGLQMSRAFGDCDLKPVISEEADFDSIQIEKGGWLVVMTDGVIDPASGSFSKYKKRLVQVLDGGASAKELVACFNPRHIDDATAIVCRYI
jgi:serine/threonine protein phosphatase PrpC